MSKLTISIISFIIFIETGGIFSFSNMGMELAIYWQLSMLQSPPRLVWSKAVMENWTIPEIVIAEDETVEIFLEVFASDFEAN